MFETRYKEPGPASEHIMNWFKFADRAIPPAVAKCAEFEKATKTTFPRNRCPTVSADVLGIPDM
jgi:hypothetical protein